MRKCKVCSEKYKPIQPLQTVCGPRCALERARINARTKRLRDTRLELKARRAALKSLTEHLNDTQKVFNEYIRLRDAKKPCISCGKDPNRGQRHASHYRPRGPAAQLRFNFLNVWASCAPCNDHKSGNLIPYRVALVEKIGEERVALLENNNNKANYSIEYANRLRDIMKRRVKHYRKLRASGH